MALTAIQVKPKQKKGGGFLGGALGGIAGAIAAPFTGGASLAAGPIGGLIGESVSPSKTSGGRGVGTLQSATQQDPNVKLAKLRQTKIDTLDNPDLSNPQKEEIFARVDPAMDILRRQQEERKRFT